jgi:hypothetical protein
MAGIIQKTVMLCPSKLWPPRTTSFGGFVPVGILGRLRAATELQELAAQFAMEECLHKA